MADKSETRPPIDKKRYRRTRRFFAGVVISFVTWEIILRRVVGARVVRKNRPERLRRYARDFRQLAVEMGGVLIKPFKAASSGEVWLQATRSWRSELVPGFSGSPV
jgi:hypothetical protein